MKTLKKDYDRALLNLKAKAAKNGKKTFKRWSNVKAVTKMTSSVTSGSELLYPDLHQAIVKLATTGAGADR